MSQETNTNTATLPLQETTSVDAAELVNTYADTLISSLFEDVDQLLDGDEAALETVTRELEAANDQPEVVAAAVEADSTESTELATMDSSDDTSSLAPATAEIDLYQAAADHEATTGPQKTTLGRIFDRFLLATTAGSLFGLIAIAWVGWQQNGNWAFLSQSPSAHSGGLSESNAEFLNYLNRSLEVIAQQAGATATSTEVGVGQNPDVAMVPVNPSVLPPLATRSGAGDGAGRPQMNVVERVYIPYQTAQPQAAQPQPLQTQPSPVVPRPQAPVPSPQAPAAPPASTTPEAAAVHVLVGVLELGERSAALFEIDGVPQRVYIGERIGSSGWSLVSVSNEEAVVRRNGEVRSIFIGQKF